MASLELGDGSPTAVLSGVTTFVSGPGTLGNLLSSFIFGIFASLFLAVGKIINAVTSFITSPFTAAGEAIGELFSDLLTSPTDILGTTAQESGRAIAEQFGWMAFPIGVGVVLLALFMINWYRERPSTGDTIVGLPFDVPDIGPFEVGTTEVGEDEADE